ncbi:MAG: hypothetical protein V4488_01895 [Pseudomonadota bacterium]
MFSKLPFENSIFVAMCVCSALLSGCASVAVTEDKLVKNTAFALGLDKDGFTIHDRVDEGFKTTYFVKTKSGAQYNCYVTGTVGIFGREVSDAMCNKKGEPMKNPLLQR